MRLECSVFAQVPSGRAPCRPAKGFVALACDRRADKKKEEQLCYLLITTRANNHPRKIELPRFRSMIRLMEKEGKATLQFGEPDLNVYISEANPERLRRFLVALSGAVRGEAAEPGGRELQSLASVQRQSTSTVKARPATRLHITSREEYAKFSRSGFPAKLSELRIEAISLRSVDMRWFSLRQLKHLFLAGNQLGRDWLPQQWKRFAAIAQLQQLSTLDLSRNEFAYLPEIFIDALPAQLGALYLGSNRLTQLPNRMSRLQNLHLLSLEWNPLEELPEDLCLLPKLGVLKLGGLTRLHFLPATMFSSVTGRRHNRRFTQLDVSNNEKAPFCAGPAAQSRQDRPGEHTAPTALCRLAAAALLNNARLTFKDSQLLCPGVLDCLPLLVRRHMRSWLRRCSRCYRLYPNSESANEQEQFERVQLTNFVKSELQGPPTAWVRRQLCTRCE